MKYTQKVAVVGCGVMGSIFLDVLSQNKDLIKILALDHDSSRIVEHKKRFKGNVTVSTDIASAASCDVIILAVKPQDFENLSFKLTKDILVISIMAGVSIPTIQKKLGAQKIIRAMPNMAARVRKGFVGWTASTLVSTQEKQFAQQIFSTMGQEIYVNSDDDINKITAISGSGPAYIFYMISCFINSAVTLGIETNDAKKIVLNTIKGSLEMVHEDTDIPLLIKSVASKGGTTEAALKEFKNLNVLKIWQRAIKEAYKKAKKLASRKV
jgi:pyrroline-5-carboxylate reductase